MATIVSSSRTIVDRERWFFLYMALAMAGVIVGGFSFNIAAGRSSFSVPLIYHLHAVIFFGWVMFYVLQNVMVVAGAVRFHRQLGWLALALVPAMLVMGIAMTVTTLRRSGGPFFFDQNQFLFSNSLGIVAFAGLAAAGIIMRRRADWHRRLMCCAMVFLTGPGLGRLLPMPLLIPYAWYVAAIVVPMLFLIVGIVADLRRRGSVHSAWIWGVIVLVGMQTVADLAAYSPAGYALTKRILAGTPGGMRSMEAYLPAMP